MCLSSYIQYRLITIPFYLNCDVYFMSHLCLSAYCHILLFFWPYIKGTVHAKMISLTVFYVAHNVSVVLCPYNRKSMLGPNVVWLPASFKIFSVIFPRRKKVATVE